MGVAATLPELSEWTLTGFLFRHIFIVGLFTSEDFTATYFMMVEKPSPTRQTTKPQKLKRQSV